MTGTETTRRGKHRLRKLRLAELSLVDRPANKAATVAVWKRDGNLTPYGTDRAGAALYAPPRGSGLEVGNVVKLAEAPTAEHSAIGNVVSDGYGGLSVRFPEAGNVAALHDRADALAARLGTNNTPPALTQKAASATMNTGDNLMPSQEKLEKAAQADMPEYGNRREWSAAMQKRAETHKRDSETVEMAMSRLLGSGDTLRQMYHCYKQARPAPVPEHEPTPKVAKSGAERSLDDLAKQRAAETGEDFYTAFDVVAHTDEGRKLMAKRRAEA